MKLQLLLLAAFCAVQSHGLTLLRSYPFAYSQQGSALVTPTQQQYLAQDQLGQYAYGYAEPLSSKQETRSLDGITRGTYSYRDAAGKLQTVDYRADAAGFHVAATNLPQEFRSQTASTATTSDVVSHTVAAAANVPINAVDIAGTPSSHLASDEAGKLRLAQVRPAQFESHAVQPNVRLLELPAPVADTAEVAAAKSIHLSRLKAEKLRNEILAGADNSRILLPTTVYSSAIPRYYNAGFYY